MIKLFDKVLDSKFDADFSQKVFLCFVPQFFEVAALTNVIGGILPQLIEGINQLAIRDGSTDSNREVFDAPVDVADVNVRLQNAESFNFSTVEQGFKVGILDEEGFKFLPNQGQGVTERVISFDDDGQIFNQDLDGSLLSASRVLATFVQSVEQRAGSTGDGNNLFNCNFGCSSLNVDGKTFQITYESPISDVQEFDRELNFLILFEEDLKRVPNLNENFVFSQFDVLDNGDLSNVNPLFENYFKVTSQDGRIVEEHLQEETVFAFFPLTRITFTASTSGS